MPSHIAVFATDIHGSMRTLKAIMAKAHSEGAKSLILGGDICPKKTLVRLKDGTFLDPRMLDMGILLKRDFSKEPISMLKVRDFALPAAIPEDDSLIIGLNSGKISKRLIDMHLNIIARCERGSLFYPEIGDKPAEEDIQALRGMVLPGLNKGPVRWVYGTLGEDYVLGRLARTIPRKDGLAADILEGILRNLLEYELKKKMSRKLSGFYSRVSDVSMSYNRISASQTKWVREVLLKALKEFAAATGTTVFVMPGNDDAKPVLNALEKGKTKLVRQIHGQVEHIGRDFFIAGYSNVPWLSENVILRDWLKSEENMAADLEAMTAGLDATKLILSTHAPPFNVPFSGFYLGDGLRDGGSKAIRGLIERKAPLLTLHGHVHEAPERTGIWMVSLAKGSVSTNPGAMHRTGAEIAIFDLFDIPGIRRIKLEPGDYNRP